MTKAQAKVYEAVERWWRVHAYAPSLQEIAVLAKVSSISTVHVHVQKLIEQGKLRRGSTYGRSLEVVPAAVCPTCGQAMPSPKMEAFCTKCGSLNVHRDKEQEHPGVGTCDHCGSTYIDDRPVARSV